MTLDPVRFSGVSVRFGEQMLFDDFSLDFTPGRWTAILGRSGVGKSSLLRLLAGLVLPKTGAVTVPPGRIAWMGQSDALLPWAPILDSVMLGARLRGEAAEPARAQALLSAVGLAGHGAARPHQLSGGMRQRVALARTLYEDGALVLMDEPFANLDAVTRRDMQDLARRLLNGRTVVFVTHDAIEAARLCEDIIVLAGMPAHIVLSLQVPRALPRPAHEAETRMLARQIDAALGLCEDAA